MRPGALRTAHTEVKDVMRHAGASRCKGGTCEGLVACWPLAHLTLIGSTALCRVCSDGLWTAHIPGEGANIELDLQLHGQCACGQPDCSSSPPIMTACSQPAWKACPAYVAKSGCTLK